MIKQKKFFLFKLWLKWGLRIFLIIKKTFEILTFKIIAYDLITYYGSLVEYYYNYENKGDKNNYNHCHNNSIDNQIKK